MRGCLHQSVPLNSTKGIEEESKLKFEHNGACIVQRTMALVMLPMEFLYLHNEQIIY